MKKTSDLRIRFVDPLISPQALKDSYPLPEDSADTVVESREAIQRILARKDHRLLAVVGPCSIHDYKAAIDYAERLKELRDRVGERIYILMRVYFEKPRTTIGWRGLIIDPQLDGTYHISEGLTLARRLLIEITGMGLPAATEMLDPIVPQYVDDLISWAAIGARTTESQTHRNMVSGLSMPVGFKNGTDGNLQIAIDAMASARHPHHFIGIDQEGKTSVLGTNGNTDTHIILRGSRTGSNYRKPEIVYTAELLKEAGFLPAIMVDCSHGNSDKRPEQQEEVLRSLLESRKSGCREVIGFMMESNLLGGRQDIPRDLSQLKYGISITDPCLSWEKTEQLLLYAYEHHQLVD
ncbi:MAG: 3-deoxy-7-phosphoheptulonate synthase [Spirochaetaceae bacterium]|nr:MAG: 3-deoxy-7-phosphoheptulonate synthase [Spirochaetaceae bacterium]